VFGVKVKKIAFEGVGTEMVTVLRYVSPQGQKFLKADMRGSKAIMNFYVERNISNIPSGMKFWSQFPPC
jgi:hypothetical protein